VGACQSGNGGRRYAYRCAVDAAHAWSQVAHTLLACGEDPQVQYPKSKCSRCGQTKKGHLCSGQGAARHAQPTASPPRVRDEDAALPSLALPTLR